MRRIHVSPRKNLKIRNTDSGRWSDISKERPSTRADLQDSATSPWSPAMARCFLKIAPSKAMNFTTGTVKAAVRIGQQRRPLEKSTHASTVPTESLQDFHTYTITRIPICPTRSSWLAENMSHNQGPWYLKTSVPAPILRMSSNFFMANSIISGPILSETWSALHS